MLRHTGPKLNEYMAMLQNSLTVKFLQSSLTNRCTKRYVSIALYKDFLALSPLLNRLADNH